MTTSNTGRPKTNLEGPNRPMDWMEHTEAAMTPERKARRIKDNVEGAMRDLGWDRARAERAFGKIKE